MATLTTDPALVLDAKAFPQAPWAKALEAGDAGQAVAAFVAELRQGTPRSPREHGMRAVQSRWHARPALGPNKIREQADRTCDGHYTGVYGIEHRFEGPIDWFFDASTVLGENQTHEWQWQINRHAPWYTLARAYEQTGDAKYAETWERQLRGWLTQCPRPADSGNYAMSAWRTIEAGIRASQAWPFAFETFRQSEHVTDEALWLFVCAMREHGVHLLRYPTGRNWKTMEANGLAHVGFMFPELKHARAFATTGLDRAIAEIDRQVYPDGLQDELAPGYGVVSLVNFYAIFKLASDRPLTRAEVPLGVWAKLENMVHALGRIAGPDGRCPAIHDSGPFQVTPLYEDFARHVDAERFGRVPWTEDRCDHLAWGGFAVLRAEGRYALLDAGPYGSGHQHRDALQLVTFAHGKPLCIDPGSPRYDRSRVTRHMRSSAGHNVVQMDGRAHQPPELVTRARQPFPMAFHGEGPVRAAAASRRQVCEGEPAASFVHERVVLDIRGLGWLVFDRLRPEDDKPHTWEWLWHLPVDRFDLSDDTAAAAYEGGPSLRLQMAGSTDVTLKMYKGQLEPAVRGWGSFGATKANGPLAAMTVSTPARSGAVWLATLMVPATGPDAPEPAGLSLQADSARWRVKIAGLAGTARIALRGETQIEHIEHELADGTSGEIDLADHLDTHCYDG